MCFRRKVQTAFNTGWNVNLSIKCVAGEQNLVPVVSVVSFGSISGPVKMQEKKKKDMHAA